MLMGCAVSAEMRVGWGYVYGEREGGWAARNTGEWPVDEPTDTTS